MVRLLYLVSHPIQYQAPLLRRIAAEPDIDLRVLFERDTSASYFDEGFGQQVAWDVPLREGYDSAVLGDVDLDAEIAKADVVWTHGWASPVLRRALKTTRRLGKTTLLRGENWDGAMPDGPWPRSWLKRLWLRRIFADVSGFLCIGTQNRRYYRERGVAENRLFEMPYAVDNDFFVARASEADIAALKADLELPDDRRVILYAGKLSARKHPEWLVQAWAAASWPDGRRPVLLFVGDGEMRDRLEAEADPDIKMAGFRNQTELPAFYALADVFVLPAEQEAWGLAVNEAMACGTAVVVSDQVGCAVDLVDRDCGAVFAAGDVNGLADALVRVTGEADALGRAARTRIAGWGFDADVEGLRAALVAFGHVEGETE